MKNTENHNDPKFNLENISDADLKRNAFKTPAGYFDNLTPRIMASVRQSEETSATIGFDWRRFLVPSLGIATVVVAALFFLNPTDNASPDFDTILASLSVEELTEYADLEATELISYELVDYSQLALTESNLTEEDILEYLSEDEIELSSIIDEIDI
jgi:hypothetical protein